VLDDPPVAFAIGDHRLVHVPVCDYIYLQGAPCNLFAPVRRKQQLTGQSIAFVFEEVAAFLKGITEVALDLETTRLDPRKDSVRLLSVATEAGTYIVACQSVDPTGVFPILAGVTGVAHNALFDLNFLSSLGFVTGNAADTIILSQLLHAGSKVGSFKRGQTSYSLDPVVKRELGLELDKTHLSSDWGDTPYARDG
jgi:ribonuclease D